MISVVSPVAQSPSCAWMRTRMAPVGQRQLGWILWELWLVTLNIRSSKYKYIYRLVGVGEAAVFESVSLLLCNHFAFSLCHGNERLYLMPICSLKQAPRATTAFLTGVSSPVRKKPQYHPK